MPVHPARDVVAFRYLYPDGRLQAVLPMWTVADDGETSLGWTPPGTEIRPTAFMWGRRLPAGILVTCRSPNDSSPR